MLRTQRGERATAFTHVIDCREPARRATDARLLGRARGQPLPPVLVLLPGLGHGRGQHAAEGRDPQGERGGRQADLPPDDWESFQVRIGPDGRRLARASSHHGYGPGWLPGT